MKTLIQYLLIIFALPAFAYGADPFADLVNSLVSRLPERDKPIDIAVTKITGKVPDDNTALEARLASLIREELEIALSKNPKVQAITRSDIEQLEQEAEFQTAEYVEQSNDKLTVQGVECMVRGRFNSDGNTVTLYAEIVWMNGGNVIKDKATWHIDKFGNPVEPPAPAPQVVEARREYTPPSYTPTYEPPSYTPTYQAPTYTPSYEDRSSLDPMIANMRALRCREESSKLYQKRLLTLLPMIRNGADVNITLPETKGNTALHYSCAIGSWSITQWLVLHGANVNAVTNAGKTPLDCVGSDNAKRIRELLLSRGAKRSYELSSAGRSSYDAPSASGMSADELNNMGLAYQYGKDGKPQNYSEAARCYRLAADQGHAAAQNNLGFCYHNGWGVSKDLGQAAMWYQRSAAQGNAWGQSNFGTCLEYGWGVSKNLPAAIDMYRRAAAQGHASAKKHLRRHGISA